jgi:hypothetical protein
MQELLAHDMMRDSRSTCTSDPWVTGMSNMGGGAQAPARRGYGYGYGRGDTTPRNAPAEVMKLPMPITPDPEPRASACMMHWCTDSLLFFRYAEYRLLHNNGSLFSVPTRANIPPSYVGALITMPPRPKFRHVDRHPEHPDCI